jgi:hypothetical protein
MTGFENKKAGRNPAFFIVETKSPELLLGSFFHFARFFLRHDDVSSGLTSLKTTNCGY